MGRRIAFALLLAAAGALLWFVLGTEPASRSLGLAASAQLHGAKADEPAPDVRRPRAVRPDRPQAPPVAAVAGPLPVTLSGRIVDVRGVPLGTEQIELRIAGLGGTRQARVQGGFYEVDGLLPGRVEVEAVAFGHRTLRASVELPIGAGLVTRDFVMRPARWVRLVARTADGRDIGDALDALGVAARRTPPRFLVSARELPPAGASLVDQGPPSPGRLHPELLVNEERAESDVPGASAPTFSVQVELNDDAASGRARTWVGLALGSVVVDSRELSQHDDLVVLQLDPRVLQGRLGGVSLRVMDGGDGKPLPFVNAWIGTGEATALGQSGADGRIDLANILPGRVMVYLVAAQGPGSLARRVGYAEDLHWIDLAPGAHVDLGDVALRAPAKLLLTIEADGRPAPPCELEVAILRNAGGARLFDPFLSRSEAPSDVELELPRRELVLFASAPDLRSRPSVVDLSAGGTIRGRLVLERATRVELAASSPAAPNWTYLVLDEEGVQAAAGRFDARGGAVLALLPGAYWLTVEDSYGYERASLRCDVGRQALRIAL